MTAPVILTRRLRLSQPIADDFDAFAEMWADPEVTRFIGGQTRDRQDSWLTLIRQAGLWAILGYGYWSVRLRKSGDYVGEVGFADYKRGLEPDLSGRPEAGWIIARPHWGQGYATEALTATHTWLDEEMPGPTSCIIDPDHTASINVAKKLGYHDFGAADYKGDPVLLFRRNTPSMQTGVA